MYIQYNRQNFSMTKQYTTSKLMTLLLTTEPSFIVLPNWEFPITPNVTQRASIPTCQPCTKGLASVSALASRILILENGIVME